MLNLFAFEQQLQSARTSAALSLVLQTYLAEKGITHFSFTYYSYYPNQMNKLKYDYASPAFAVWHQHYLSEHYEEIDSAMDDVTHLVLPYCWNLQQQLRSAKTAKERQMRLDSIAYGIEQGVSIPLHGVQGDFANLVLAQIQGQAFLAHWQESQYEFFAVAYYYFSYLQKILLKERKPAAKHQLNQREYQCLLLTAQGLSVALIAKKLAITERTVNYYLQRLNKKLGTKNKHESVSKAVRLGIM